MPLRLQLDLGLGAALLTHVKWGLIQTRSMFRLGFFLACFLAHTASLSQESFRSNFVLRLGEELNSTNESGVEVATSVEKSLDENLSRVPWIFSFTHIGRGLENGRPFQMLPVLGVAYKMSDRWLVGAAYDFQSFAFELSHAKWSLGRSRQMGWSLSIVPELKSFSWKAGPWFSMPVGHLKMMVLTQVASMNTLGYGLWAEEINVSSRGREYLFPSQLKFEYDFEKQFQVIAGLEGVWSLSKNILRSHFGLVLGLTKEFP